MPDEFFSHPILNSPYVYPNRHWELDDTGQPTQAIIESRRRADFITPIQKPRKQKTKQTELDLGTAEHISTGEQQYDTQAVINDVRRNVDDCARFPIPLIGRLPRKRRVFSGIGGIIVFPASDQSFAR